MACRWHMYQCLSLLRSWWMLLFSHGLNASFFLTQPEKTYHTELLCSSLHGTLNLSVPNMTLQLSPTLDQKEASLFSGLFARDIQRESGG